jgi:hypothetical protein
MIRPRWLENAQEVLWNEWLDYFDYAVWTNRAVAETVFYYAASGMAIAPPWQRVDQYLKAVQGGRLKELPEPRCDNWESVRTEVPRLRVRWDRTAFGWFTYGNAHRAWQVLDDIKYIGPKIASWI